ncbi:VOC family protein [Rhizobium sp. 2YAF20]|uniref:VOC family protein n=1 Tax=Rhizobium sp. 2YAF20 TaxID=3233027 RepID=UPI003F99DAD4
MAVIGMGHIHLAMPVGQEDIARSFYEGLLGLKEVAKPQHLAALGGCWFETNGVRIHLGVEDDFSPASKAHPGLVVSDLPPRDCAGCSRVSDIGRRTRPRVS